MSAEYVNGQWIESTTGMPTMAPVGAGPQAMSTVTPGTNFEFMDGGLPGTVGQEGLAGTSFGDTGFGLGDIYSQDTGLFGTGMKLGDIASLGNLFLGYQGMQEQSRMNDKSIEAMNQNIAGAKTEAKATADYRAAYGA